jgi:hypothetical protein
MSALKIAFVVVVFALGAWEATQMAYRAHLIQQNLSQLATQIY